MDIMLYLIIILIPLIAQIGISSSYKKYKSINVNNGLTGQEAARKILDMNGLEKMYIVEVKGNLTDHYDPSRKVVRLSTDIYYGNSIAAVAVAAHECGHAIQDKEGYLYMKFRSLIYPVVRVATTVSYIIIVLGAIFEMLNLIYIGIALVSCGLIFQLVTLPVEINASKRALEILEDNHMIDEDEQSGAKAMLTAAAMTYVAGVLSSALEVLRLILIFTDHD